MPSAVAEIEVPMEVPAYEAAFDAPPTARFWSGPAIVFYIAAAKLAIHLYAARFYGYFADELYFMACSRHLEWGYVDQPPLIALIVRIERVLFGDSLQSIRLFAAIAGAAPRRGGCARRRRLPGDEPLYLDECIRAAGLGGVRADPDSDHQNGQSEIVALVRLDRRHSAGKQVWNRFLCDRRYRRPVAYSSALRFPQTVDLARRTAGVLAIPSQPGVEHPTSLSIF